MSTIFISLFFLAVGVGAIAVTAEALSRALRTARMIRGQIAADPRVLFSTMEFGARDRAKIVRPARAPVARPTRPAASPQRVAA
ncbi:hypothetical protein [Altericroceibacterium xinjiangense]|uniref:hypothetical protein n=1 Tax=Altericroceibacterium xinjiangense TaxID=762261 RepID=UPI000F7D7A94|nr:hypothetical protein [Altericroceibacterium xinjiangense]